MKRLSLKYIGTQLKIRLARFNRSTPTPKAATRKATDPASLTQDVLFLPSRLDQDELNYLVSDKAIQVNGITYFKDRL